MKNKKKIILIGNISNTVSGSSLSFTRYYKRLVRKKCAEVILINTNRKKNNFHNNFFKLFFVILKLLYNIRSSNVISFNSDERAFILFGPIIFIISKIFKKKIVSRAFGGSLDLHFQRYNSVIKLIFKKTILKSDTVLLQTNYLISYFSGKNINLKHLPTSRKTNNIKLANRTKATKYVFLGRLSLAKGISYLSDALNEINRDLSVDLYGLIEDSEVFKIIKSNPKLNYKGQIDHKDIYKTIVNYDVLILPTFYEGEGYPGAIIEAFHCGMPVISTDWRSISEIVDDTCGILIPIKSKNAIKDAILKLHNNDELFRELQAGALVKSKKFNEENWFNYFYSEL